MKIIVVRHDEAGGVGGTTIAFHIISFGAELGLKVAGASIDGANNLRPWMRLAGLPWVDALCDDLPSDVDLLVIDVGPGARSVEVLRPSLTLLPVDRAASERSAAKTAATVVGDVLRVRNYWHGRRLADDQLTPELESVNVILDRCNALRATGESLRPVWVTPLGAASAGARTIRELAAEVLCHVGLLPPDDAPYERQDPLPPLDAREKEGIARLGTFFERFAASQKAEAETCPPKPWMLEWARDLEEKLAKKK
ncbi:MAG: hypothetical protein JNL82_16070 [Myxococcales bacterium]|nr:hypothetical protein [Myxococcales bacterium]